MSTYGKWWPWRGVRPTIKKRPGRREDIERSDNDATSYLWIAIATILFFWSLSAYLTYIWPQIAHLSATREYMKLNWPKTIELIKKISKQSNGKLARTLDAANYIDYLARLDYGETNNRINHAAVERYNKHGINWYRLHLSWVALKSGLNQIEIDYIVDEQNHEMSYTMRWHPSIATKWCHTSERFFRINRDVDYPSLTGDECTGIMDWFKNLLVDVSSTWTEK